jgi:hypothetical protein
MGGSSKPYVLLDLDLDVWFPRQIIPDLQLVFRAYIPALPEHDYNMCLYQARLQQVMAKLMPEVHQ